MTNIMSDEYPLLSALMIVNSPEKELLNFSIDSFEKQDYPNKELIIINNANNQYEASGLSIDARQNIFLIDTPIKLSSGQARNYAISASNGLILAQFDYDSWHSPSRLSVQISSMAENDSNICFLSKATQYSTLSHRKSYWENDKNAILNTMVCVRPSGIDYPNVEKNEEFGFLIRMIESGMRPMSVEEPDLVCKIIGRNRFDQKTVKNIAINV